MSAAPHPSRSAPLCSTCRHAVLTGQGTEDEVLMCNHPAAPVSPIDGRPRVSAVSMRYAAFFSGPDAHMGRDESGRLYEGFHQQAAAGVAA